MSALSPACAPAWAISESLALSGRAQDAKRDIPVALFPCDQPQTFVSGLAPLRGHGFGTTCLHHGPFHE